MLELEEVMEVGGTTRSLREKLSLIQYALKAPKNLRNSFGNYNYRNAEGILEAFKPYEASQKVFLTVGDEIVEVGGRIYVKATATIYDVESNASISNSAYAREAETKKGMDESQITGTASSYARKYALNGLFLLDDTKDADTDEYTARAKGLTKEDFEAQKKDNEDTAAMADAPIDKTRWSILQKEAKKKGVTGQMILDYYNLEKASDITYGLERQIIADLDKIAKAS